jgi:hypothetical protein
LTFGLAGAGLVLGIALALATGAVHADGIMLIEAGAFWTGSDSDDPNEAPPHRAYVRDFWRTTGARPPLVSPAAWCAGRATMIRATRCE